MKCYLKQMFIIMVMSCFTVLAHADLKISDAWVKPTVPGQPVAAAYMTLMADKDLAVVEVSSPVAGKSEIHSMSMDGNIMRMKKLDRLPLKSGAAVALKPGGFHIMLMDLNHQIKEGEVVSLTLTSQDTSGKKSTVTIKMTAKMPEASASDSEIYTHH